MPLKLLWVYYMLLKEIFLNVYTVYYYSSGVCMCLYGTPYTDMLGVQCTLAEYCGIQTHYSHL